MSFYIGYQASKIGRTSVMSWLTVISIASRRKLQTAIYDHTGDFASKIWRAECVIIKTYKLTYFTDSVVWTNHIAMKIVVSR